MRNIGHRDQLAWKHVELIRKKWKGKLVVKGLVSPADARIARESGVDGVMLSNHGGRQLDYTMSGLRTLPEIAAEAKGMTVMVDGGIRRGTDVIKALGARRAFRLGRPSVPLCRDRRRRGRRAARDHAAAGRDRPRSGAARHPHHQRDHAGSGAEVLRCGTRAANKLPSPAKAGDPVFQRPRIEPSSRGVLDAPLSRSMTGGGCRLARSISPHLELAVGLLGRDDHVLGAAVDAVGIAALFVILRRHHVDEG